ncbi:hypothetical protein BDV29DRAFT_166727 [Aspergillus leporis]|jgi:hypothetical protein|uniref:Mitochondrial ATPase expression-domain-containing protein n=1 Tax=Aspergillus leporis TaxID=41062 RepID=A0A5N5XFS3_9EURO|nr:hypothetical protein BDV29DRAFT_166727 [Aspergillus leporis]
MQRLWSRAAPAHSTCHCVSCLSTAATGITSRATSAASKRRLRIGNSITALYTSIFAAAALADAKAKDQRRLEWKEKIAAVKEEVNELVDEEQRLLAALTSRRKRRSFNHALPSRQYSTLARSSPQGFRSSIRSIPSRSIHSEAGLKEDSETLVVGGVDTGLEGGRDSQILRELVAESEDPLLDDANEDYGLGLEDDTIPAWLSFDVVRQKVIRKLALKQLAIRLLLRPAIAHTYMGLRMKYDVDHSVPRLNVVELLAELNSIRRRLRHLKTRRDADIDDLAKDLRVRNMKDMARERMNLDQEVRRDTELYLSEKMSLQELLLRLANNLLQATDPDRPYSLKMMLIAFAKGRQNDLGDLVLKTVLPHKFPLTSSLILSIFTFYRKSKNLKGFDLFLEMLRGEGYPVDMNNLGYYKRRVINGVEISIPPVNTTNAVVYSTLIVATLRFDQPDRADAYLQAARAAGYMDDFSTLNAYMKFYAIRTDWDKGVQTIKRALAYMASSTEHSVDRLERLAVLMVHLCDSCGKYDVSEVIITAAINSGFDWKSAEKQLDVEFPFDPHFRRWHVADDTSAKEYQNKPVWERCYAFVNSISEQLNDLALPEDEGSAKKWHKLMGTYSQEVLSAVLAGPPAQYKKQNQNSPQKLLTAFDVENERFHRAESTAEAQQKEIMTLKDEVAQLKQMVFELSNQASANPSSLPQSAPNDFGRLKNHKPPGKPALEQAPKKINIRYVEY